MKKLLNCNLILIILSLGLSHLTTGCASSFPGILPTPPAWVSVGTQTWRQKDAWWVFARGQSQNNQKIIERRSMAEAAATQNLRQKIVAKMNRYMSNNKINGQPISADEIKQVKDVLAHLPWAQLCSVEARFFDVERNIQHALVGLSWHKFEQAVSQDTVTGAVKSLVKDLGKLAFQAS